MSGKEDIVPFVSLYQHHHHHYHPPLVDLVHIEDMAGHTRGVTNDSFSFAKRVTITIAFISSQLPPDYQHCIERKYDKYVRVVRDK